MSTAERVKIGQRWTPKRGRGHLPLVIRQIHRADRIIEAVDEAGSRSCVGFATLRRDYREAA